jgi:mRNA-degrading endonuclease RelE of RelBE toxin-antitoxin system
MQRTQLYLPENLTEKLRSLSKRQHKSISQLVREALEATYLGGPRHPLKAVLKKTKGIWKGRTDVNTDTFIRKLRNDTRPNRFYKNP